MDCDEVVAALDTAKAAVEDRRHSDPDGWRKLYVKALARRAMAHVQIGADHTSLPAPPHPQSLSSTPTPNP